MGSENYVDQNEVHFQPDSYWSQMGARCLIALCALYTDPHGECDKLFLNKLYT